MNEELGIKKLITQALTDINKNQTTPTIGDPSTYTADTKKIKQGYEDSMLPELDYQSVYYQSNIPKSSDDVDLVYMDNSDIKLISVPNIEEKKIPEPSYQTIHDTIFDLLMDSVNSDVLSSGQKGALLMEVHQKIKTLLKERFDIQI